MRKQTRDPAAKLPSLPALWRGSHNIRLLVLLWVSSRVKTAPTPSPAALCRSNRARLSHRIPPFWTLLPHLAPHPDAEGQTLANHGDASLVLLRRACARSRFPQWEKNENRARCVISLRQKGKQHRSHIYTSTTPQTADSAISLRGSDTEGDILALRNPSGGSGPIRDPGGLA